MGVNWGSAQKVSGLSPGDLTGLEAGRELTGAVVPRRRIKQEWQLALVNVLTAMTCNGIIVWSLAPCRSYGNTFRFDLENTIQKLPNNIFENSYPMREFDLQKRIYSFFYKAAEFSLLGLAAGTIQGAITKDFAAKKEGRLSVTIPSASSNALGYGAF
ncbi:hypothetical protein ZIOFF_025252 [Zingiber officinale]|uniref:Uncharacterized protein n=1 Tax=Zingiber officinale TaxID=94328 RepID=A0A8J5LGV0_ZINOF|nr:hypothetical protein ZIOFF_025252 [Zingiber officinale]